VSGDVVYVGAKNGDRVTTGELLLELDAVDAEKTVRDAETNLESANLSLQKLKIQNSNNNLTADATKAYNDGFNTVASTLLDLPNILDGLESILAENNLSSNAARINSKTAENSEQKAEDTYYNTRNLFNQNAKDYRILNNNSAKNDVENIILETYNTTKSLSDAVKNVVNFVNLMSDNSNNSTSFTSYQSTLSTYTDTLNSDLSNLLASTTNINSTKDSFQNSDLDIQSAELSVKQKNNALQDAKDKLADYFIRAPFDGTLANLNLKKVDSVSSGTQIASIITSKQLALMSFNEVDVTKIKLGQKATLTFDAVPDLTISGTVTEIDSIGIISQGVVTYDVKVSFDTQDDRVKPSMSVSAAIITDAKQGVLVVPNSSIKSQNGTSYIEMFDAPLSPTTDGLLGSISKITPNKIPVEVGLSNDSDSEIVSGIKEGDAVVSRTILPTSGTATPTPSLFGSSTPNRGATGGAGTRIPGR
jgi:HlyD family secretion protein